MNRERLGSVIFCAAGAILFVVGAIFLGIGIHKSSKGCKSEPQPVCPPSPQNVLNSTLYHFSLTSAIKWDDDFADPNSDKSKMILETFKANVTNLLSSTRNSLENRVFTSQLEQKINNLSIGIWPDYLAPSENKMTIFYGSLLPPNTMDSDQIGQRFKESGWISKVSDSSIQFCQIMDQEPTPSPEPFGNFPCDPRKPPRTMIFMVDVAMPVDPEISPDEKLKNVKRYLASILPQNSPIGDSWKAGLGVFDGGNAYLVNNWLCTNQTCWKEAIDNLFINGTSRSHNTTRALEFVRDEFTTNFLKLPIGSARSVTILSDGFEYDGGFGEIWSQQLARLVAETFYLSFIVPSQSKTIRSTYSSLIKSGYQTVFLDHWTHLALAEIFDRQLWWICLATPIIYAPPTLSTPTWAPIEITTTSDLDSHRLKDFCQDPQDIALLIEIPTSVEVFQKLQIFLSTTLLRSFAGLDQGYLEKLTRFSIFTYSGVNVTMVQSLPASGNITTVTQALSSIPYQSNPQSIHRLSSAYTQCLDQFRLYGREYASWSAIVFTEAIDQSDLENLITLKELLDQNGLFTFGIGLAEDKDAFRGAEEIWTDYQLIDGNNLNQGDRELDKDIANFLRDKTCDHLPGEGRASTISTTTPVDPTKEPGILAQGSLTSQPWPDICILIDVSATSAPNEIALNDQGFEAIRIFLINTLIRFKIGADYSLISLITFDEKAQTVFHFGDHQDWESLYKALTINWQYGTGNHTAHKNLEEALTLLLSDVYQPTKGARNNKYNQFLWLFTTGPDKHLPPSKYQDLLKGLGQHGIHIIGIPLGDVDMEFMRTISSQNVIATNYLDPENGLASPLDQAGPQLFQLSTNDPPPPIPRMNSDIVFVIDMEISLDSFENLRAFLRSFVQTFTVGAQNSRFALLVLDSQGIISFSQLKDGLDMTEVLNRIDSIQNPANSQIGRAARYDLAIDLILKNLSQEVNGKRADVSSFVITLTQSTDNSYQLSKDQPLNRIYTSLVLCLNEAIIPYFVKQLASKESYAYLVGDNLLDWSLTVVGGRAPLQEFFQDLQTENLLVLQTREMPTMDIATDISIVLDLTNLEDSFDRVIDYLTQFIQKFTIGLFDTQVSGISFGKEIESSFSFSKCQDVYCIGNELKAWKYSNGSDTSLLTDVLTKVSEQQLMPKEGWRQSKTFILIFSAQDRMTWDTDRMAQIEYDFHAKKAFLYYLDMANGSMPAEMRSYFDQYQSIGDPKDLLIGSVADQDLTKTIATNYKEFVYPTPLDLDRIVADFVFLIDVSSDAILEQIKILLTDLISGMSIGSTGVQVSIVFYSGDGILANQTILLNQYQNREDLSAAIATLEQPPPTKVTDLGAALEYLLSNVLVYPNGYRGNLVYLTFFSVNPSSKHPLQNSMHSISTLQSNPSLNYYGFVMNPDQPALLVQEMKFIFPSYMSTRIIETALVLPNSKAISGNDGYVNYIIRTYTSYIDEHTTSAATTTPGSPTTTPLPTTTTTVNHCPDCQPPNTNLLLFLDASIYGETFFAIQQDLVQSLAASWNHFERVAILASPPSSRQEGLVQQLAQYGSIDSYDLFAHLVQDNLTFTFDDSNLQSALIAALNMRPNTDFGPQKTVLFAPIFASSYFDGATSVARSLNEMGELITIAMGYGEIPWNGEIGKVLRWVTPQDHLPIKSQLANELGGTYPPPASLLIILATGRLAGERGLNQEKELILEMISVWTKLTRLAIGCYSNEMSVVSNYREIDDWRSLKRGLDHLIDSEGIENVTRALEMTSTLFVPPDEYGQRQKVVLFIPNVDTNDIDAAEYYARQLQDLGSVTVVGMGMNDSTVYEKLASPKMALTWTDINDIDSILKKIDSTLL